MSFIDRANRLPPKKNCSICKGKGYVHVRDCPCTKPKAYSWTVWSNYDDTARLTLPDNHPQLAKLTAGFEQRHTFKLLGDPLAPGVAEKAFKIAQDWWDCK